MTTPISDVPLANGDADGCTVPREPWLRLFLRFLRFGALAWGGPVAQIAMIRQELVDEDRWISSAHFNRVLAVYQVLPGPEAHELCVYFGMRSRGRWGGVLAGLGFMLPGFVLMFALSWAYVRYGLQTEGVAAVFAAVQVAVAALIVRAVVRIGEHVVTDRWLWGIAIGATAAQLAGIHFGIILTVAGGIYLLAQREFRRLAWALAALAVAGVIGYAVAMGGLAGFAALSGSTGDAEAVRRDGMPMLALFWSGLKAGLLTFGGAYTVIPFLQRDAVTQGVWMSNTQFLEGLALSGLLPAPLIIFSTYFGVQVYVAINNWRRPFGDLLQNALTGKPGITDENFYSMMLIFCQIAFLSMFVSILTDFFVSHYVFRWRTAMNDFYMSKWERVRHIEGASQRVQEDTMRFANILEGLGISLINSVMTLIAFLPILFQLSTYITTLPIIGAIPHSLFWLALLWSMFGTALLAIVGIKLPGLQFRNQRVEAAYRKELVYGEDHAERADPVTVKELFANVRRNYFRMYFHYLYFNVARYFYIQADGLFVTFMLVPTIVAGKITYGIYQQILTAFGQVSNSFQYLVNSWTTIIELLSIHKRLKAFEAAIEGLDLPSADQRYLATQEGMRVPVEED